MEINAQAVIKKLANKIAQLESDLAIAQVQIETINEQVAQATYDNEENKPLEGEVIA